MEGKRLDDQTEMGWEVGENPRLSLNVGFEKVANICSEKFDGALFTLIEVQEAGPETSLALYSSE